MEGGAGAGSSDENAGWDAHIPWQSAEIQVLALPLIPGSWYPGGEQVTVQVVGSRPPKGEVWVELTAPGLGLAQHWLFWASGEWNRGREFSLYVCFSLSLSLTLNLPDKINKYVNVWYMVGQQQVH